IVRRENAANYCAC
ncbi:hypothetical protein VCHC55C2_3677B, partial [Vibrio cholerae HC-55C2]